MNKISASVLAGLLVLGLGACNADSSKGRAQVDPPAVSPTDTSTVSPDRGCPPPNPRHIACAR